MNALSVQEWIGAAMLVLGIACLWAGGRMEALLPKPWNGPPQTWLPESRRVLRRAGAVLTTGAILLLCGALFLAAR
jgi:hypothetical protein